MQLPKFKGRASGNRTLLTNPQSKKDKEAGLLGKTAITAIQKWAKDYMYGSSKQMTNKYVVKGLLQEDGAIKLAAKFFGALVAEKNDRQFETEYFTGTPDVILTDEIWDIKCSFSHDTFPFFEDDIPTDAYDYQLQTYMSMASESLERPFNRAKLIYVLMDAPEHLIESEAWSQARANGDVEVSSELYNKVKREMTYSHLPIEMRVKSFDTKLNLLKIAEMKTRIHKCREFVKTHIQPKADKIPS